METRIINGKNIWEEILKVIKEHPGIYMAEIKRKTKISERMICHCVNGLKRDGLIETRMAGQRRYCYPKGMAPKILLAPSTQKVFEVIKNNPGIPINEAVRKAGVSDNGWRYVAQLDAARLVYIKKEGRRLHLLFPRQNAARVNDSKAILPLSQEEIDALMTPGKTVEEIISNSGKAGRYIRICINSSLAKCGVVTIKEARLLLGISLGKGKKVPVNS